MDEIALGFWLRHWCFNDRPDGSINKHCEDGHSEENHNVCWYSIEHVIFVNFLWNLVHNR